jgi:ParB/RepB/Spo0J family partition protein
MSAPKRGNTILTLGEEMTDTFDWDQLYINLSQIEERPGFNPRTDYGEHDGTFAALVESIRDRGMLELPRLMPIVDKRGDWDPCECRFTIVAGHRRIAAAKALGWESIRACVPDADGTELAAYTEGQQLVDALVENLQRKELNCIEVAEGIARLEKLGKTQADIAKWIGKDQGRVSKTVRLLELPVGVRALLREGVLSASHGEELLPLLAESFLPGEIYNLAQSAVDMSLTKAGLRNVVQDKIKRGQPVQLSTEEVKESGVDYAPAHNFDDERIARTLASTKGMDKAELPSSSQEPKPTPREDNGLTRKDADGQFAAAMAPDPDVVPLSSLPATGAATEEHPRVILGHWLHDIGLNWIEAAEKLHDITGPGGDVHKPGMWFRLEPGTAQKLLELCDWHEGELGMHPMQEKLKIIVEVYHGLMLERMVEAEKAKAALSAGFPVFEEPS